MHKKVACWTKTAGGAIFANCYDFSTCLVLKIAGRPRSNSSMARKNVLSLLKWKKRLICLPECDVEHHQPWRFLSYVCLLPPYQPYSTNFPLSPHLLMLFLCPLSVSYQCSIRRPLIQRYKRFIMPGAAIAYRPPWICIQEPHRDICFRFN